MPLAVNLYSAPFTEVDYSLVLQFVLDAEQADLFSESLTFEVKGRRNGNNVAEAVAALYNTDGGIVLVGIKEDATGEDRVAGVPKKDLDGLVSNLHDVMPEAMPEIIPVRIPDTDKLVIVLRMDADAVAHPVTVAGKVLYRVPGHTVPADRQRILDLVARDRASFEAAQGTIKVPARSWRPADLPLWPDESEWGPNPPEPVTGTLRVVGGLILPRRILDRPWLDTRARRSALDVLNNSPLRITNEWSTQPWTITEARATYLHLRSDGASYGTYRTQSAAYLNLTGRRLSLLLGFRWLRKDSLPEALGPELFYWALLGSIITIASTCRHVARELDAADPSDPDSWEGWLQPGPEFSVLEAVDLLRFDRDNTDAPRAGYFPPARTRGTEIESLDELARNWLTYWLLDLGARDFEEWFAARVRPQFLQIPELA